MGLWHCEHLKIPRTGEVYCNYYTYEHNKALAVSVATGGMVHIVRRGERFDKVCYTLEEAKRYVEAMTELAT